MKHHTPPEFHEQTVFVELIGAGATGSKILAGLVQLHHAMLELGHPRGLHVRCWDFDMVSHSNLGRQLFTESDLGCNKAVSLISRYNYHYSLEWTAEPQRFTAIPMGYPGSAILISAVDSRKSRSEINQHLHKYPKPYLIDCGCGRDYAQCAIGNGSPELPYPWQLYPDWIDPAKDGKLRSSCSMEDALNRQGLFTNQWIATAVLEFIWQLFRFGGLDYSELYINLQTGRMTSLPIMMPPRKKVAGNRKKRKAVS